MDEAIDWFQLIDRYFALKQDIDQMLPDEKTLNWYDMRTASSEALIYFIQKHLNVLHSAPYPYDLIDFVPASSLGQIAETLITILETGAFTDRFTDTIKHISFQSPEALHPYLDRLFNLILARDDKHHTFRHYVCGAWRGATQLDRFFSLLRDPQQPNDVRANAWICLMNTHNVSVMYEALAEINTIEPRHYNNNVEYFLHDLGYDWGNSNLRPLYQDEAYHFIFKNDYISQYTWSTGLKHPTYHLDLSNSIRLPFGGVTDQYCWRCRKPLHHILTTPPELTPHLNIHSRKSVGFVTCLSCIFGTHFYQHDEAGVATAIPHGNRQVNFTGKFVAHNPHPVLFNAIGTGRGRLWHHKPERMRLLNWKRSGYMETEVALVPTSKRWQWQGSDIHQNLHRMGGFPMWIQKAEYPKCPKCDKDMVFVMQLKDQLPLEDGTEQDWGDTGMGYFYWCDDCAISGFIAQTT